MHSRAIGKGEAVLLIHGMPTNGRLWDGVATKLSHQYRCIVIDLPGMGRTPALSYGPSYFATVASQIEEVRRRHHIQRWHLVGHDGGAAIAVQYARLFPRRVGCLTLLSPAIFPELQPFFLLNLLRQPFLGEMAAPLVSSVFWRVVVPRTLEGGGDPAVMRNFRQSFSGLSGSWRLMRLVRWGKPASVFQQFPAILKRLTCPTLVVHGKRDFLPESFARRAVDLIPDARMIALDSGHFIPLEQAEQVSLDLIDFFQANRARTAGVTNSSRVRRTHSEGESRMKMTSRRFSGTSMIAQ